MTAQNGSADGPDVATLASRIATTGHESLSTADVDAFERLVEDVDDTLTAGDTWTAANRLASFWKPYLRAGLDEETDDVPTTPTGLVEAALLEDVVGIDLYQALLRFFDVYGDEAAGDGDAPKALDNWSGRVFDLTADLCEHVLDHHR